MDEIGQGADAREGLLGRIFGYAAFSQAGRAADAAVADRLATSLVAVMGRKAFLREAAANALLACAEALPDAVLARLMESNEALRGLLLAPSSEATPEACPPDADTCFLIVSGLDAAIEVLLLDENQLPAYVSLNLALHHQQNHVH